MFNRTLGMVGNYRRWLALAVILLLAVAATAHHIGSATTGLSPAEAAARTQSSDWHHLLDHPLNAPHNLVIYAVHKIGSERHGVLRLASYVYALVFAGLFYYLARGWFGRTVGIFSALIFCLSPFFLITARVATAQIMFFWPLALMAAYYWLNRTDKKSSAWLVLMLSVGLSFYTPGLVWWLLGAAVVCRKKLLDITGQLPQAIVAAGLALLVLLLVPAGLAVFRDWHFLKDLAALPGSWPGPVRLVKDFGWMISSLSVKTPYHDQLLVGRLPLLDLLQMGLLVFGVYAMGTAARLKAAAFGLSVALAVILAAFNNNLEFLFIGLPAIGMFMAAGLRYLYIEWRSVFPRNPIPKSLALVLMAVLVGIQLVYGLSYSLIAWPHTSDTKTVYVLK
jgi:hypothetical protein